MPLDKVPETIVEKDIIRLVCGETRYEGAFIQCKNGAVILKLSNGYNTGILLSHIDNLQLIEKAIEHNSARAIHPQVNSKKNGEKGKPAPKDAAGNGNSISILSSGGTISSRVEYTTGAVFPVLDVDELLSEFPEIAQISPIRAKSVFSILSEDLTPKHWQVLAEEIREEIKSGCTGVVILHGTDTMHYTSAALSFMLQKLPVPVVLVGAQRSPDRGSSDNRQNLISALLAAKSDIATVSLCMHSTVNDDSCLLHLGTKVRKLHSSRRDAFKSVNRLPIAKIFPKEKRIEPLSSYDKRGNSPELEFDNKINGNVGLLYAHPGIKPQLVDKFADYDGIVVAGTGFGHVSTNPSNDKLALPVIGNLKALIDSDVKVVMAPQTIFGRVNLNVYSAGRLLKEIGVIGDGCDFTPETALVKLMWVLGHEKKYAKVKKEMETNIAGEITERSLLIDE